MPQGVDLDPVPVFDVSLVLVTQNNACSGTTQLYVEVRERKGKGRRRGRERGERGERGRDEGREGGRERMSCIKSFQLHFSFPFTALTKVH